MYPAAQVALPTDRHQTSPEKAVDQVTIGAEVHVIQILRVEVDPTITVGPKPHVPIRQEVAPAVEPGLTGAPAVAEPAIPILAAPVLLPATLVRV